ncbi:4-hydroxybenzoate octaprenyltransferase [Neisseria leonii]|uniref:4-hydroxybenzoate octaprenyltransferase n=1 Tax=Neisseria leonii TaxID=2995413 RepID=UPI00237B8FAC|nr:4-hydroxybenzoate octaprenyltransferase [Neisseria sp. 3986]MDD9324976.1 4-hydroxybenzoate octaprenyltransferase [Neisseria sp. 3986]
MTETTWRQRLGVYGRLMRVDKPVGTLLLLWPTLWALFWAADGRPDRVSLLAFCAGTFLMRSAGCVANDLADRDFDGAVARTAGRPFARGEVKVREAVWLIAVLCAAALLCLLPLNRLTWLMSLPALFLALTYPYTKRFFPIPQFYLGLAFSFGIPMAFAAVQNRVPLEAWLMFAANACWTLAYDTVYAMADKEDDLKIGIKTSAVTFGNYDKEAVMLFHAAFSALMAWLGWLGDMDWPYWLAWIVVLVWQMRQYPQIRTRDRSRCFEVFLANNRIGAVWLLGIVLSLWR